MSWSRAVLTGRSGLMGVWSNGDLWRLNRHALHTVWPEPRLIGGLRLT